MSNALMGVASRALQAQYAALQTTSNNIANSATKGYSRQTAELETASGLYTSQGFFGQGVNVATVSRAHDQFLTKEAATSASIASGDAARLSQLQQLEKVFPTGDAGIGSAAGAMLNSFVDVASAPQDSSARQVALARSQEVATRFKSAGESLANLQAGVTSDLKTSITAVNGLARQIAKVNDQIASAQATGQSPNDLLDQRDQLVTQIGNYVQVSTIPANDGSLGVFIAGGQQLVLGNNASTLVAMPDEYDSGKVQVGVQIGNGTSRALPSDSLGGGSISGLIKFQNEDMAVARNQLGQMAAALSSAVNNQQALGLDLTTVPQAGGAIFSVGAPTAVASNTNQGTAKIALSTADASQLQASDYQLSFDGSNYQLTRLSDKKAFAAISPADMAAGVTVDGMTMSIASGTAAAGDTFKLQPVANAAQGMSRVLADPNGIAAASPLTSTVAVTNTGTLGIAALTLKAAQSSPDNVTIRFDQDPSTLAYSYSVSSDGGSSYGAAQPMVAGQPISYSDSIGKVLWQLQTTGSPRSGDTLSIAPTVYTATNNGNALAMVNMRTTAIVGLNTLSDGTLGNGSNITDAYASTMASVGVRVQTGTTAAGISKSVAADAETARANGSGVNLDEEAARLIQFQQSYQAAAKVLQVAQSLFDTVLSAIR
ncbi:MAG: flagellar hook protein [Rhizobacter sp.]|nr:flagellar hook protein [Rhizobacter sp.]